MKGDDLPPPQYNACSDTHTDYIPAHNAVIYTVTESAQEPTTRAYFHNESARMRQLQQEADYNTYWWVCLMVLFVMVLMTLAGLLGALLARQAQ